MGQGGITGVARPTGIAYSTIVPGLAEPQTGGSAAPGRVRRRGGGRQRTVEKDPTLLANLEGLVEPTAAGDRMSPLRWTTKSVRQLAATLQAMGHGVSRQLVAELLAAAGDSLQGNRKTREGTRQPDRDAQFRYINQQVRRWQARGQPVISVDTKKKESSKSGAASGSLVARFRRTSPTAASGRTRRRRPSSPRTRMAWLASVRDSPSRR